MPEIVLRTKLFIPPLRPNFVPRPRLIERLNQGLHLGHKLILISAPAGFGKTTLASEWLAGCEQTPAYARIAWLSLDEGENDPKRFLTYFVTALQTIVADLGEGVLGMLQSPQSLPIDSILTVLLNEISTIPDNFILVLDDYHVIDAQPVDDALTFLLEHQPPQLHLVIATREDPPLPLSRLRARGQMSELRAADLRFTPSEAAEFLNQAMSLDLSIEDVNALEARTEGWIAGLQLAAISMQGRDDSANLVKSFTGSHRLVLDYLIEEVLNQQPLNVQDFLLQTAILNLLTGPLCDAVTGQENGQGTLEILDRTNLFVVPLDEERRWYRYHHLFADLLRQRLRQNVASSAEDESVEELHKRASKWYEANDLEIEAFYHAAAANDLERAERLIEGDGLPLSFRGAVVPVLNWLASLPVAVLDAKPSLWVTYAMAVLVTGQLDGVEEKLQAASAALEGVELDDKTRDLVGRIADTRGTMAVGQRQPEILIAQSRRALEYLHPDNLTYRTSTTWKLGVAYEFQGDRTAAHQAYTEAITTSEASGNIQKMENQLYQAVESFQHALQLVGDLPIPVLTHVHLQLARISYEWNDLEAAEEHGQKSIEHARPFIDQSNIFVDCELFLSRLKLAQGDEAGAAAILAEVERSMRQDDFEYQMPEIAAIQVLTLLGQEDLAAAADLAEKHKLPISQARVYLAQGDTSAAVTALEPVHQQVEAKGWVDELLKVIVLQAVAYHTHGEIGKALQMLGSALALAEPGGFIRTFVDEGAPMAHLLYEAQARAISADYVPRILAAFQIAEIEQADPTETQTPESEWVEPLSRRELDVLQLIAEGLSNQEVASRLYLSLNTVKAHTRSIYSKLGVNSRTQAVARARALGILASS